MYGRLATMSVNGACAASGAPRSPSTKVTAAPSRSAFARATSSAAGETSTREDGGVGAHLGQRDRERARAGADVGDARRHPSAPAGNRAQRLLDQRLGVGRGTSTRASTAELELPELLAPGQVRDRLARLAPLDQVAQRAELLGRQHALELHVELHARQREHVRDQQLGVEARRPEAALGEPRRRPAHDVEHGPGRGQRRRRASGAAKAARILYRASLHAQAFDRDAADQVFAR